MATNPQPGYNYATWTWPQVQVAIYGVAYGSNSVVGQTMPTVSDPSSFQTAMTTFLNLHATLDNFFNVIDHDLSVLTGTSVTGGTSTEGRWVGGGAARFGAIMSDILGIVRYYRDILATPKAYWDTMNNAGAALT